MAATKRARKPRFQIARPEETWSTLGLRVHPEVHKALKLAATEDRMPMERKLHLFLCKCLGRKDLIDPPSAI